MNERERLFFKNVILHKSMSYKRDLDKQAVIQMRNNFRKELKERQRKRDEAIKANNSFINIIKTYIYDCIN